MRALFGIAFFVFWTRPIYGWDWVASLGVQGVQYSLEPFASEVIDAQGVEASLGVLGFSKFETHLFGAYNTGRKRVFDPMSKEASLSLYGINFSLRLLDSASLGVESILGGLVNTVGFEESLASGIGLRLNAFFSIRKKIYGAISFGARHGSLKRTEVYDSMDMLWCGLTFYLSNAYPKNKSLDSE